MKSEIRQERVILSITSDGKEFKSLAGAKAHQKKLDVICWLETCTYGPGDCDNEELAEFIISDFANLKSICEG